MASRCNISCHNKGYGMTTRVGVWAVVPIPQSGSFFHLQYMSYCQLIILLQRTSTVIIGRTHRTQKPPIVGAISCSGTFCTCQTWIPPVMGAFLWFHAWKRTHKNGCSFMSHGHLHTEHETIHARCISMFPLMVSMQWGLPPLVALFFDAARGPVPPHCVVCLWCDKEVCLLPCPSLDVWGGFKHSSCCLLVRLPFFLITSSFCLLALAPPLYN